MAPPRLNATLRRLLRAPALLYRGRCGWLLGNRFLLLVHTGRRTGRTHRTVLEVMRYHSEIPEWSVMCAFGRDSGWLRNIEARPDAEVWVGTRRIRVRWRLLDAAEAAAVVAYYERRNRFAAPVVRAAISWLSGWHYDGSEAARRRLAAEKPFVAFRATT
jgi:deazaflavin-dependent oxidoreductase (nitroreductase family)